MANRYRVVRVRPNGNDWTVIQDFPVAANAELATEQAQRAAAMAAARGARDTNGWRTRVYSANPATGDQSGADLVWDSTVNE